MTAIVPQSKTKEKIETLKNIELAVPKRGNRAYRRKEAAMERTKDQRKLKWKAVVQNKLLRDLRAEKVANRIKKVQAKKAERMADEKEGVRLTKKRLKRAAKNKAILERKRLKRQKYKEKLNQ